jgi:hypothetical protein
MAIGSNHGRNLGLTNGHYPVWLALMRGRFQDIIWNFVDQFLLILIIIMICNAYVPIMACMAKAQLNLRRWGWNAESGQNLSSVTIMWHNHSPEMLTLKWSWFQWIYLFVRISDTQNNMADREAWGGTSWIKWNKICKSLQFSDLLRIYIFWEGNAISCQFWCTLGTDIWLV